MVLLFTGQAELNIDAKSRLAIPARYRNLLSEEDGKGWFTVPWPDGTLRVYPERVFAELASQVEQSLVPDDDLAELEVNFFGSAERIEMDSAGRITLPKHHVELAGLPSEVVVIGARHRLEVRDRASWQGRTEDRFKSMRTLVQRVEERKRR